MGKIKFGPVKGVGPKNARIAIVGEAPGRDEEREGVPFVGASGRVLNSSLKKAGIKRYECYLTNVVKTRPPKNDFSIFYEDKKKTKPKEELIVARAKLIDEINEINPNVTIALGGEAVKALTGQDDAKITNWRGSIMNTLVGKVVPTFHPAYILRVWKANPIMLADLNRAREESLTPDIILPKRKLLTAPTFSEVKAFLEYCKTQEYLSFDIETMQGDEWFIDCVGLAPASDYAMCIPLCNTDRTPYWSLDEEIMVLQMLADVLSDYKIKKIGQNAQYDIIFLESLGVPVNNLWFDTMNAAKVLNPEFLKGLDFLTSIYTREPYYKDTSRVDRWVYNAKDAACTYEVAFELRRDMAEAGVLDFYFSHVHPLISLYIDVQQLGVNIDQEKKALASESVNTAIEDMRAKLLKIAGKKLNVKSTKDMRQYLYEDLRMPKKYNKAGNLDTSKNVIRDFHRKTGREDLSIILNLRKSRSNKSTYINADTDIDGRMRTAYDVSGTETGRLSSKKAANGKGMNLQNVEHGVYREMFVPDKGFKFLGADLSQAENRVVAYLSKDKAMIEVVEGEGDIHTNNAAMIFDKPVDKITREERNLGKRITHGANYLMGSHTFAIYAETPVKDAKFHLRTYHGTYPGVGMWHRQVERIIRQTRTLTNPFGRKRYFNERMGQDLFREAVAFVPQSTVADLLHRATLNIRARLPHPARVVLQLHDAITIQVPDDEWYIEICKKIMEEELTKPFEIEGRSICIPTEVKIGDNWEEVS